MSLNHLCANDISDDDCLKCAVRGITLKCPMNCPDFEDIRLSMSDEFLDERDRLIKAFGLNDRLPWED